MGADRFSHFSGGNMRFTALGLGFNGVCDFKNGNGISPLSGHV